MLDTQVLSPSVSSPIVKALYAKAFGQLYKVELKYKGYDGKYILRPVNQICTAERMLHATDSQLHAMKLFPFFGLGV